MRGRAFFRRKAGRRDANHAPICRALKALKYFYVDTAPCGGGVLDLLVYDRLSNPHWVELKTATGELRAKQLEFIAELDARGIAHGVARTLDEVLALVGHHVPPTKARAA